MWENRDQLFSYVFGWDTGTLGDQAWKDFAKESLVGLKKEISKAANMSSNF